MTISNDQVSTAEQKVFSMDESVPVGPARAVRSCRHYHPRDKDCIMHDLCDRRDIAECPVRTRFCQLLGESDTAYAIYTAMHACTPRNEAAIRGRA